MLKIRVIPQLLTQDGLLKKPVQFKNPRTVANPVSIARVFEERQVDELILVDRSASLGDDIVNLELVKIISEQLYVPFTYGGGIKTIEDMKNIIQSGAEKIVINTSAVENPELISKAAEKFGSQCIVVSVDAYKNNDQYNVFIKSGTLKTSLRPEIWAKEAEDLGAGEILINSINNEGMMKGYDINLIRKVADNVNIPVIAAGGAGNFSDFIDAVKIGHASAVVASSIYHYTKITPNMVKGQMHKAGISVRMYNDVDYEIT